MPEQTISPAIVNPAPGLPCTASKKARILVVDDERSICVTLREFLQAEGYEVDLAEDAHQAWALLRKGDFDVVVSDIVLPSLSGIDLLKMIRNAAPDVQVIIITGNPTAETAAEAVRAGARDYLFKPIAKDTILRAVATALHIRQIEDAKRRLEADNRKYQKALEALIEKRTADLQLALDGLIRAMAAAVEFRDAKAVEACLRMFRDQGFKLDFPPANDAGPGCPPASRP
jgi:DNA-binding NtrC family response regulator